MLRLLKKLPVQLFLSVVGAIVFHKFLSLYTQSVFFSISSVIKEILLFGLPFLVCSYLAAAIISFEKSAPLLILFSVLLIIASNALTVLTSFGIGSLLLPWLVQSSAQNIAADQPVLFALWHFPLSPILEADRAMLAGLLIGLLGAFLKKDAFSQKAYQMRDLSTTILRVGFIPVLPLYVFGFVLKLAVDSDMNVLIHQYGRVFALNCMIIVVYIFIMYVVAAKGHIKRAWEYIEEMLPAGLTGFSTMSSAAAMPVTLKSTQANLNNESYPNFIIPITVNNHLIGDGLNIALTGLALLLMAGQPLPNFESYMLFVLYYCVAKFSCAGIPGGGVIIILPVIQTYLGLSPEATSLLATIYILQDPLLTGANVMGNGAFALITHGIFKRCKLLK